MMGNVGHRRYPPLLLFFHWSGLASTSAFQTELVPTSLLPGLLLHLANSQSCASIIFGKVFMPTSVYILMYPVFFFTKRLHYWLNIYYWDQKCNISIMKLFHFLSERRFVERNFNLPLLSSFWKISGLMSKTTFLKAFFFLNLVVRLMFKTFFSYP